MTEVGQGRVLIVAGSDSGGGAGIQADIKTVTALGGYAMTAITAVTVQDTTRVHAVHAIPPEIVSRQMRVVLADIGADCIKTGMLHDETVIEAVAAVIEDGAADVPLVVDPVMVATSGDRLLREDAERALKTRLLPLATLITPNLAEAEALLGEPVAGRDTMTSAAARLRELGPAAVLVTGGDGERDNIVDVLATESGVEVFASPRLDSRNTHGTGCTLASAIATGLAKGKPLHDAVQTARAYVHEAIRTAPDLGKGHGPLHHGWVLD